MLQEGDRVRHPSQDAWGLGKVIEVQSGGRARIFFEIAGEKTLLVDRVHLIRVAGHAASSSVLDEVETAALRRPRVCRSLAEMKAVFLRRYPQGFADARYVKEERRAIGEAAERLHRELGSSALRLLLADGRHDELTGRILELIDATPLVPAGEREELAAGLKTAPARRAFAIDAADLIAGRGAYGARFARFTRALFTLGIPRWPLATYLPALADPAKHLFVLPATLRPAAEVCHAEVAYRSEPNWETYHAMVGFAQWLSRELTPIGARDLLDVQAFVSTVAKDR